MTKVYPVTAVLLLCCAGFGNLMNYTYDYELNDNYDVDKAWEIYKVRYPFVVKSDDEYTRRKANFAEAHASILKYNALVPSSVFSRCGHSEFSIMDEEEKPSYSGRHIAVSEYLTYTADVRSP